MIFSPIIYYLEYLFQLFARPNYPFMLNLVLDKLCPKLNWASPEKNAFKMAYLWPRLYLEVSSPRTINSNMYIFWKRQINGNNGDDDNEKDVFKSLTQAVRKKKPSAPNTGVKPMTFWWLVKMLYHWATENSRFMWQTSYIRFTVISAPTKPPPISRLATNE